jgi:hypothetical protein
MSVLHEFGNLLRAGLGQIPLPFVRALFVAIPLLVMVWVLRLPPSETTPPQRTGRWDENLKIWAWLALAVQVVIYCTF